MDAEERKAELMKENKMSSNLMFKMDFDPRIIGNKILPDGTRKTGIGQFIRSTSLDEFPQFFNVLIGQMSLVGFRPALKSEYEEYEFHHRARIAMKPGITGMWQVSGRSDITDFEEVVKLDTEYIRNWSMGCLLYTSQSCGYRPILAHFERYRCLREWERLDELKERGTLLQMNFDTLLFGGSVFHRNPWKKAIENGLVDYLGSDCHGTHFRPLETARAVRRLTSWIDPASADELLYERAADLLKSNGEGKEL